MGKQRKPLAETNVNKPESPVPETGYRSKLKKDAKEAITALADNGTGGERKNVPFRPYEETRLAMVRLAADLTEQRGELVKVHDMMIEAMNDYFKKYNVDHVARRPTRKKV